MGSQIHGSFPGFWQKCQNKIRRCLYHKIQDIRGEQFQYDTPGKRSTIDNIDLRWAYFFAPGEIISFSAFYKYFRDPIEQRDAPITNNPEINYENIADSRLFGLEMEFRKQLDFIPALQDFQIGTNLTYIFSEMEEDSLFLDAARKTDPNYPARREMFGQSPYIVNAFLGYFNPGAGIRSDLVFNVSGPKIFLITKGGLPNVYEQPFPLLDFNISKSIGEIFPSFCPYNTSL